MTTSTNVRQTSSLNRDIWRPQRSQFLGDIIKRVEKPKSLFRGEEFILAQGLGKELKTKIMRGTPSAFLEAPKEYVLHK